METKKKKKQYARVDTEDVRSVSEALRAHEVSEAEYVSGPSVPGAGRAPGKVDSACEHRPRGRRLRSRAARMYQRSGCRQCANA